MFFRAPGKNCWHTHAKADCIEARGCQVFGFFLTVDHILNGTAALTAIFLWPGDAGITAIRFGPLPFTRPFQRLFKAHRRQCVLAALFLYSVLVQPFANLRAVGRFFGSVIKVHGYSPPINLFLRERSGCVSGFQTRDKFIFPFKSASERKGEQFRAPEIELRVRFPRVSNATMHLNIFLRRETIGFRCRNARSCGRFRQFSTLVVDNQGIRVIGPRPQAVEWQELSVVRLKFFSTWRDRKSGWMQLSVKGKGGVILVDQALGDFQQLADIVFMVARNQGLSFDRNTRQNAESLGLDPGPDEAS